MTDAELDALVERLDPRDPRAAYGIFTQRHRRNIRPTADSSGPMQPPGPEESPEAVHDSDLT